MSFGWHSGSYGDDSLFKAAIDAAYNAGIPLASQGGNSGAISVDVPAACVGPVLLNLEKGSKENFLRLLTTPLATRTWLVLEQ